MVLIDLKHKILFFSILSVILLVFTAIDVYALSSPVQFHYGPVLYAEKLSAKPTNYIALTDPDPYLLEALSNPSRDVFIGSWDNTNLDELVETYQTNNVEYNNTYYTVTMVSVDVFIYGTFFLILIFSWIVLGLSFLITQVRSPSS